MDDHHHQSNPKPRPQPNGTREEPGTLTQGAPVFPGSSFGNRTQNSRVAGARPIHQADRGSDPNHRGIWSPPRVGHPTRQFYCTENAFRQQLPRAAEWVPVAQTGFRCASANGPHRQHYADNQNISFLPAIMTTSARMHGEFLRLLFLQAHRETTAHFKPTGLPSQQNQSDNAFRFKRAAFYMGLKSKVGLVAATASALRINLNIQGCSVVAPSLHARSHAPLLLPLLPSHAIPLPRVH